MKKWKTSNIIELYAKCNVYFEEENPFSFFRQLSDITSTYTIERMHTALPPGNAHR